MNSFEVFLFLQFFGQVGFFVVLLVSFSVLQFFHELRRSIADVQRNGEVAEFFDIVERSEDSVV